MGFPSVSCVLGRCSAPDSSCSMRRKYSLGASVPQYVQYGKTENMLSSTVNVGLLAAVCPLRRSFW